MKTKQEARLREWLKELTEEQVAILNADMIELVNLTQKAEAQRARVGKMLKLIEPEFGTPGYGFDPESRRFYRDPLPV